MLAGVLVAGSAAIAGACSDDASDPSRDADAGGSAGTLGSGICPEVAPDASEPCLLPEGTTCAFGACGTPIARCERGAWVYGATPPPSPPCPALFPMSESPCPPCWPADLSCTYGTCIGADASANTTVASCPNGAWKLDYFPCDASPDPPDEPSDAGADVQRDSEADAD